jgi:anti-anti-sigma regulatory factor
MSTLADGGVTTTLLHGCVVVAFPSELGSDLERAQRAALARIHDVAAHAAVLDLSSVRFLDKTEFEGLRALAGMLGLLGTRAILIGLRPSVVAWLVTNDVDLRGLEFERDLEGALARLGNGADAEPADEDDAAGGEGDAP